MAVKYGFYDSLNGDRKYNALDMSRLFEGLISDGVFATIGGGFVVTESPGTMNINVATGRAWFNYTWTLNDANLVLTVPASEVALHRIDTVVIEVNSAIGVRANQIRIVEGTPASSPVPPTLSHTSTLNQYGLANIAVNAGVTEISQANITNLIGTAQTPFITGVVDTLDFASLLGRFESDFTLWLANLQDQLDDNQAGNLQVQIDKLVGGQKGWIELTETFTYLSSTTMSVTSDATLRFQKGWGIRFKQGGAYKYMYISGVAPTVLTFVGGDNFTIANAAITDVAISSAPLNALGFLESFTFNSPTITGFSTLPTSISGRFWLNGRMCTYVHFENAAGISNGTGFTVSLPFQLEAGHSVRFFGTVFAATNNGVAILSGASVVIAPPTPTVATLYPDAVGGSWSATGDKRARFQITYPIA